MTHARVLAPREPPRARRLMGWLPDGTPHYVDVGVVLIDGDYVCCHLCGEWFRSVASHLRVHGWAKDEFLEVFGLERSNTLAGAATHRRRSAALRARRTDAPIRQAQEAARQRARSGELAAAAAAANRGRFHPIERRAKTLATLAAVSPERRAAGTARRAQQQLFDVAAKVATDCGFPDFASYVADGLAAGRSLAALSREAGLHKDWVSRHRALVAPVDVPAAVSRLDARWLPVLEPLGFDDVAGFLSARHLDEHRTVRAIAAEVGFSRGSVQAALRRHGIEPAPYVGTRHAARERDDSAAHRVGHDSLVAFVQSRRAAGVTWKRIADETGVPVTTLRRRLV